MDELSTLSRRSFLGVGALAAAALAAVHQPLLAALPRAAPADDELPEAVKRVLKQRFGDRPIRNGHVQLDVPEIAPDGRAVPIFVETDLPVTAEQWVKAIHLVVDHNPDIYLAGFHLSRASGAATIDTRIKMRRSSHVRAIVETSGGELWTANAMVYVTLNGCV